MGRQDRLKVGAVLHHCRRGHAHLDRAVLSSVLSAKFRHINDTLALINRAQAFSERLLAGSKDLKDTLLYISSLLSDRMVEAKLSAQCTADIANIGRALQERKLWAAKSKSKVCFWFIC